MLVLATLSAEFGKSRLHQVRGSSLTVDADAFLPAGINILQHLDAGHLASVA